MEIYLDNSATTMVAPEVREEMMAALDRETEGSGQADTLIVGGTSLNVYPAASFIDYFTGNNLVVINKSETARMVDATLIITEPIGEVLSQIEVR